MYDNPTPDPFRPAGVPDPLRPTDPLHAAGVPDPLRPSGTTPPLDAPRSVPPPGRGGYAESGKARVADSLSEAGHRITERGRAMIEQGGPGARAGRVALRAGEKLHRSAGYLQTHETEEIRADVEDGIRARPLLSVAIAAVAGFMIGRVLRD